MCKALLNISVVFYCEITEDSSEETLLFYRVRVFWVATGFTMAAWSVLRYISSPPQQALNLHWQPLCNKWFNESVDSLNECVCVCMSEWASCILEQMEVAHFFLFPILLKRKPLCLLHVQTNLYELAIS